jgi:hypothetical protein
MRRDLITRTRHSLSIKVQLNENDPEGAAQDSNDVTFWTDRVTAFGTIMRRILFPQSKYVKQFSDLRDKSLDPGRGLLEIAAFIFRFLPRVAESRKNVQFECERLRRSDKLRFPFIRFSKGRDKRANKAPRTAGSGRLYCGRTDAFRSAANAAALVARVHA